MPRSSRVAPLPLAIALAVAPALVAGAARAEPARDQRDDRILPAAAIARVVDPYVPELRRCWERHAPPAARGDLRVELVIAPDGAVWRRAVVAAGVPRRARARLERCVLETVAAWRFPPRPGYTTTVVPFLFLRTQARGAGPAPSCFSARGCPERARRGVPR